MINWLLGKLFGIKAKPAIEAKDEPEACHETVWHNWEEHHCGSQSMTLGKRWVIYCPACKKQGKKNHRWCD